MKIGYLRFNNPVELYLPTASARTLGSELRTGLLHDWHELGHEITIYSHLPKFEQDIIEGRTLLCREPQIEWIRNIKYDLQGYPSSEDILFIECGSTNTKWSYTLDGQDVSYIWRCIDAVANFEGKVVFFLHSPLLPFPFSDAYSPPDKKLDHRNLRQMFKVIGGPDALFKNKEWVILSVSPNFDIVKEIASHGHGFTTEIFDQGYATMKFFPLGYSDIDPLLPINPNPKWDAIFIGTKQTAGTGSSGSGGKYCKLPRIRDFYDHQLFRSVIFGNWERDDFKYARVMGQNKDMHSSYVLRNNAWVSVVACAKGFRHIGMMFSRSIQIPRSGTLCLGDRSIKNIEDQIDPVFHVGSAEEMVERLEWIKDQTVEDREVLRKGQLENFTKWKDRNWEDIFEV